MGKTLVTLRGAAQFIIKLPKAERDAYEWQSTPDAACRRSRRTTGCVPAGEKPARWHGRGA
jgi:hypothetical protein